MAQTRSLRRRSARVVGRAFTRFVHARVDSWLGPAWIQPVPAVSVFLTAGAYMPAFGIYAIMAQAVPFPRYRRIPAHLPRCRVHHKTMHAPAAGLAHLRGPILAEQLGLFQGRVGCHFALDGRVAVLS